MKPEFDFPQGYITTVARRALEEDVGAGDLTAELVPDVRVEARLLSRNRSVVAGAAFFDEVFRCLDEDIGVAWQVEDGQTTCPDDVLCTVSGRSHPILTGERSAINLLQTLSGTATQTRRFADIVSGTGARILDTRKTIPGLRLAQKYAVLCGGGHNHRIGLFDGILVKENHLRSDVTIEQVIRDARDRAPGGLLIEIEVENLTQLKTALDAGAPRILLDNFPLERLRQAVEINEGRALLEASGGINESNLRAVAETGVDFISIGAITKNLIAADFSLRFA
jgi:nicotinate-nucleotide pyrophosphorylase (carboxylating)